jgi:hypothetical protein
LMAVGGTFPQAMRHLPLFAVVLADPQGTALEEVDQPRLDHIHIAQAVAACHWHGWNGSLSSLPSKARDLLRISQADLEAEIRTRAAMRGEAASLPGAANAVTQEPDIPVQLSYYERSALYQSDRVRADRLGYAAHADTLGQRLRSHQIVILLINAAAAFLIGLKTLALNKDDQVAFRSLMAGALLPLSTLALLMPVIGTAMSGLVAFDDDASTILRDGRTVSQLEQLHGRIVSDIVGDPFICQFDRAHVPGIRATALPARISDPKMLENAARDYRKALESAAQLEACRLDRFKRAVSWEQRHEQILNEARASLAQAGNLPGPSARPTDNPPAAAATGGLNQGVQVTTVASRTYLDPCQLAFEDPQSDGDGATEVASSGPAGAP